MRVGGACSLLLGLVVAVACGRTDKRSAAPADCGECVLDCRDVACATVDCNAGSHMEMHDDECCPVCVKDDAPPCDEARAAYQDFRAERLAEAALAECVQEVDCFVFSEHNRCASTCIAPVSFDYADRLTMELDAYADENCSRCPAPIAQPCPNPGPMVCDEGACKLGESFK